MRRFFIKLVAGLLMSPVILSGGAAYAASCSISHTGPGSTNDCKSKQICTSSTDNKTKVDSSTNVYQSSKTGETETAANGDGGDATSGAASNENSNQTNLDIKNDSSSACQTTSSSSGGKGGGTSGSPSQAQPVGGEGAGQVAAQSQVSAPVGGVGAGDGGTIRPYASLAVLVGSMLAGGLGLRLLRQVQED